MISECEETGGGRGGGGGGGGVAGKRYHLGSRIVNCDVLDKADDETRASGSGVPRRAASVLLTGAQKNQRRPGEGGRVGGKKDL
jgi:hypothetical protein